MIQSVLRGLPLVPAAVALAALTTTATAAPVVKNCNPAPSAVSFKASTLTSTTTSATYAVMPETNIPFTQGGTRPGCVIVFFSGLAAAAGAADQLYVRATVDSIVGLPEDQRWSGNDDDGDGFHYRSRGVSFVFPSIPPGPHILRIQFRAVGAGGTITTRNTILYYVP